MVPSNYFSHQRAQIYQDYEEFLKKNYSLDFDDLILKSIEIFEQFPLILEKWQNRLRHILVDEFQDVDPNQFKLLCLLAGKENEVTVVGDPDQTIYTWRGANIKLIMNLGLDFKDVEDITLEKNYRSTQRILDAANALIKNNKQRLEKNLFSDNFGGKRPLFFNAEDGEKEAEWVANKILDLRSVGYNYSDIAVLYRSSYYTRNFEQVFMKRKLPYCIFGGLRFYQRKEIKVL